MIVGWRHQEALCCVRADYNSFSIRKTVRRYLDSIRPATGAMFVRIILCLLHPALGTVDIGSLSKSVQDKIFLSAVQRDGGGKGSAFPRIVGPRHSDKVCIVGAGPAGLHMALELKLRNFTNLVIFERDDRVGGKSYDVHYRGLDQPLGTIFAIEEYFDNLIPLARRYGVGDLVKFVKPAIIDNFKRLELTDYIGRGPAGLLLSFLDAIRYVNLHKHLFGTYRQAAGRKIIASDH